MNQKTRIEYMHLGMAKLQAAGADLMQAHFPATDLANVEKT
jgi:hypothetical protein